MNTIPTTPKSGTAEAEANGYGGNFFLTPGAARHVRLSPRTLERHRVAGSGPRFARLGRRVVYRLADLEDWARRNTFTSTAEAEAADAGTGAARGGEGE